MRALISGTLAVVLLAGCATTPSPKAGWTQTANGEWVNAREEACRDYASTYKTSTTAKALIYASNIVVWPVTAALTLGLMPLFVYPRSDEEQWGDRYQSCLRAQQ